MVPKIGSENKDTFVLSVGRKKIKFNYHHHVKIGSAIAACEVKRSERGDGKMAHFHGYIGYVW